MNESKEDQILTLFKTLTPEQQQQTLNLIRKETKSNAVPVELVLNREYGLSFSELAQSLYIKLGGKAFVGYCDRDDPKLVYIVKKLGKKASGKHGCFYVGTPRVAIGEMWDIYDNDDGIERLRMNISDKIYKNEHAPLPKDADEIWTKFKVENSLLD